MKRPEKGERGKTCRAEQEEERSSSAVGILRSTTVVGDVEVYPGDERPQILPTPACSVLRLLGLAAWRELVVDGRLPKAIQQEISEYFSDREFALATMVYSSAVEHTTLGDHKLAEASNGF